MGFGDPDHHHPLQEDLVLKYNDVEIANCFRCELPITEEEICYGCGRCDHYIHVFCSRLPQNMTHPLHPEHSMTLLHPTISSSQIAGKNCNLCLKPFVGGYAYHCQACLTFNLHLECFLTLNLETKHPHPLHLSEDPNEAYCGICGLLIDSSNSYVFTCRVCKFVIHFDCTFLPPKLKHRHVHELTFEYNYPEGSKIVDCDVCLDDKELDRNLSYYYCNKCDYIAHVRCVTSQPPKVTTQLDHFSHEHPIIFLSNPDPSKLTCAACKLCNYSENFYFCSMCNYALHKSCALFPQFFKHPRHHHTLSLQSSASKSKDCRLLCCEFCTEELEGKGWILQCPDCDCAVHLSCACDFKHPLYKDITLSFSSCEETKFRCNACGELGGGFKMSPGELEDSVQFSDHDLHLECFALPGQIEHGCHSHPLYLVSSPTEIESYLSTMFQCDICHTEADPEFWVYVCIQCKYIAHLKCVVSDLLPLPGQSCDFANFCSIAMCDKKKFRVSTKPIDCLKLLDMLIVNYTVFLPGGIFKVPEGPIGDHNVQAINSVASDLDKSFTNVLHCPKCELPISAQAYSSAYDWLHCNLKASICNLQIETPTGLEPLHLLDEKVVDELYCPICNLSIFPPTYSCVGCQIYFHKSCAELPHKYTMDGGHTFVLQPTSMRSSSLTNCSNCKCPLQGYAYVCAICEIGFDVTCALGSPLLKLGNQKHSFYTSTSVGIYTDSCTACDIEISGDTMHFACGAIGCDCILHLGCAMLPSMVKVERRIHHHPLVLEYHLDLSVDDYICDVCEKELNPCIWVYRCSDSCGDRATFHVSCIVNSNKKCHFIYEKECSYPHLDDSFKDKFSDQKMEVPALAAALVNTPPEKQKWVLRRNLLLFVDELEHEYGVFVTDKLMKMDQAEVLHLIESPDALRAKVAESMKELTSILLSIANDENKEYNDPQVS